MSQPFHIMELTTSLHVLRDDLLPGGTKRRALDFFLQNVSEQNLYYAGTTMGHGALALAHACAVTNKTAHIYISADENDLVLQKLSEAGAKLYPQKPMTIDKLHAISSKAAARDAISLLPGFAFPAFENALIQSLKNFDASPYSEIWTSCVTGTLTRTLQKSFPDKTFKIVKTVKAGCDLGNGEIFQAPEKYHRPAKSPPPYPSCAYTDAKVWQFAESLAKSRALIWNTAG